jgi:mono/diheme cytochrome c family protein
LALGALKPRQIEARDLRWGVFHGGGRPEDIYQRIYHGIPGTPMPAAPMRAEDARPGDIRLTPRDLWDLVAFVLSLSGSEGDPGSTEIARHVSPPIEDFRAERRHMN